MSEPDRLISFAYRGYPFFIGAEPAPGDTFRPVVFELSGVGEGQRTRLPDDTDNAAYATRDEALRHAEQQAERWVHDRSGSNVGQS